MALSTIEAKYVALVEAVKEALRLKGIIKELGLVDFVPFMYCDS